MIRTDYPIRRERGMIRRAIRQLVRGDGYGQPGPSATLWRRWAGHLVVSARRAGVPWARIRPLLRDFYIEIDDRIEVAKTALWRWYYATNQPAWRAPLYPASLCSEAGRLEIALADLILAFNPTYGADCTRTVTSFSKGMIP